MAGDWQGAIERARAHSPFLALALSRQSELAALLERGEGEAALALAKSAGEDDVGTALRRERLALATTLAIGDLAGAFPLNFVMAELSAFYKAARATAKSPPSVSISQRVPRASRCRASSLRSA